MSRLDIICAVALAPDQHMLPVSNAAMLALLHERLGSRLSPPQLELYEKLLRTDRCRYVAADTISDGVADDYLQRYTRFRDKCAQLTRACARELLEKSGLPPRRVACVVTNTTVGGMVPNLSSVIGNELGLPSKTRVIDLGYMGCATALLGLELAERQLKAGEFGIVLSAELTSVMTNLMSDRPESLIANTVFGDGVGAFLVAKRPYAAVPRCGFPALRILQHAGDVQTDDESMNVITYEPNPTYHEIHLNEGIIGAAERGVRSVLEPLIRQRLASPADKMRWLLHRRIPQWQRHVDFAILHTAGSRVLEGLIAALKLSEEQAGHNHHAFRRYSNTSSASLYYALHELLSSRTLRRGQQLLFLAYGSGFFTRAMLARVVHDGTA